MAFFRKDKRKSSKSVETERVQVKPVKKRRVFPAEVKLLAIDAMEAGMSIADVSEIIGAGSSTIIKWRKIYLEGGEGKLARQAANPGTRKICSELERRIERMRLDNPEAGVRRIRDELHREQAIGVSAETVRRVVNDAGLGNPPVQRKRRPPQPRRFEKNLPNTLWQIDIFTFKLKRMFPVYLVGMIDDHSRYIVGHGLFRQQTAESVLEVVKGAIGQWGAPREILSDNGRQFAAWRGQTQFQKVLKRQGVNHVRSAPPHPMTLGKIERFWKTIWTEFLEDAVFASFADARQRLDHWVGYYNHQRPHQGINGACPADRFYGVADDINESLNQGCKENALQLALGQETRPPLYLLGKLGDTDIRVIRKGEDIEVKLGENVHEVIRAGSPFGVDDEGRFYREEATDEMEGLERGGALPCSGDSKEGRDPDRGDLQDLRGEQADPEYCDREGGPWGHGGAFAEESRTQEPVTGGTFDPQYQKGEGSHGQGACDLETEIRNSHDLRGPSEAGAGRGAASWREDEIPEKKNQPPKTQEKEAFAETWPGPDNSENGEDN
jgi:transposase InsO family protein